MLWDLLVLLVLLLVLLLLLLLLLLLVVELLLLLLVEVLLLLLLLLMLLVLLVLLVHFRMGWRDKVLSRHDGHLLAVHAHAKLHVVLVEGLLAVLLDFCSTVLEPVLRRVSPGNLVLRLQTDVDLIEGHP